MDIVISLAVDTVTLAKELEFPIDVAAASNVVVVSEQERTRSFASTRVSFVAESLYRTVDRFRGLHTIVTSIFAVLGDTGIADWKTLRRSGILADTVYLVCVVVAGLLVAGLLVACGC